MYDFLRKQYGTKQSHVEHIRSINSFIKWLEWISWHQIGHKHLAFAIQFHSFTTALFIAYAACNRSFWFGAKLSRHNLPPIVCGLHCFNFTFYLLASYPNPWHYCAQQTNETRKCVLNPKLFSISTKSFRKNSYCSHCVLWSSIGFRLSYVNNNGNKLVSMKMHIGGRKKMF